ncbi:MAG: ATP-binding protein [Acidimicrobiia bacterium]|nr:ATP-binding protein [Acidimicrobiia bacterium]
MIVEREITPYLISLFRQYPFVTVTGPRQSGKTTLCQAAFPEFAYANLEAPDQRHLAEVDPRGFLGRFDGPAIIDEIQHVPELLSYLQVIGDERKNNGQFVLTGSEQFPLADAISQTLAGRTALLRLLPFSLPERQEINVTQRVEDILFEGFYPRLHDQGLGPNQALGDYFETYVERDVRRLGGVGDLSAFRMFMRLCAGRVGRLVNLSSLGDDAGITHTTARAWLTILERSYILFRLHPLHANLRKRLVKTPKLYFYDVGLAAFLIGIEQADQIVTHPLRGALFENAVIAEAAKYRYNTGRRPNFSFYRDAKGLECDLLYETGEGIVAIESKSGATIAADAFRSLERISELLPQVRQRILVYGGADYQNRTNAQVSPIFDLHRTLRQLDPALPRQ